MTARVAVPALSRGRDIPAVDGGRDSAQHGLSRRTGGRVDDDLEAMSRDQLIAAAKKLRAGIRAHRDGTGHELCWHHPDLWGLLPERTDPVPAVPAWPEFLRGCLRYRESLDEQLPDSPRSNAPYESCSVLP
jgi:hypothetical protein